MSSAWKCGISYGFKFQVRSHTDPIKACKSLWYMQHVNKPENTYNNQTEVVQSVGIRSMLLRPFPPLSNMQEANALCTNLYLTKKPYYKNQVRRICSKNLCLNSSPNESNIYAVDTD